MAKAVRPINVVAAGGSLAAARARDRAGLPAGGLPATPDHDLVFHGGRTMSALRFTSFYLGAAARWPDGARDAIDAALAAAMADAGLNNVLAQYFTGGQVASAFEGSAILEDPIPGKVGKEDVESLVRALHERGDLAALELDVTVCDFLLPPGVLLAAEDSDSRHGLAGYHGSVHTTTDGREETVYYAVGVYSETQPDGTRNGIPVFDEPWKNVVATFYHELCEARTDPDVEDAIAGGNDPAALHLLGWVSRQGEECGDFPVFEADPLTEIFQEVPLADGTGTVPVQLQYSNAVHGPQGPAAEPVSPRARSAR